MDNDGNYLLGGHTTTGDGVVNWDYLAIKVNSQTRAEEWRKTYGQPRGQLFFPSHESNSRDYKRNDPTPQNKRLYL